jgi:hypothetical protein
VGPVQVEKAREYARQADARNRDDVRANRMRRQLLLPPQPPPDLPAERPAGQAASGYYQGGTGLAVPGARSKGVQLRTATDPAMTNRQRALDYAKRKVPVPRQISSIRPSGGSGTTKTYDEAQAEEAERRLAQVVASLFWVVGARSHVFL